jgi:hypothetical protein
MAVAGVAANRLAAAATKTGFIGFPLVDGTCLSAVSYFNVPKSCDFSISKSTLRVIPNVVKK